jgi:hypothetical protein
MFRNPDVRNVILLLGLAVLLWIPRWQGPIDLRYDGGVYYILGTALAEGKGYRLLYEPGEIQAIQYPPLLPAFVACHEWILASTDPEIVGPWLRRSFCLIFLFYVPAIYVMARHYLAATEALLVAVISTLYLHSYFLSDLLFAEIPFALIAILFVVCNRGSNRGRSFVLTAGLGIAAVLLRTAGTALLAAWVAESVLQRAWRQVAIRTAIALAPLVAWQGYVSHAKSGLEYQRPVYPYQRASYLYYNVNYSESVRLIDPWAPERGQVSWRDLPKRFLVHLTAMPMSLGEGMTVGKGFWEWCMKDIQQRIGFHWLPLWVVTIPIIFVGSLAIAGTVLLIARREWLLAFSIIASVGLMCLTPWPDQFSRYLTPVTPFLALSVVQVLAVFRAICQRHWSAKGRAVGYLVTVLIVGTILSVQLFAVLRSYQMRRDQGYTYAEQGRQSGNCLFFYDQTWRAFDTALAWLKQHARPDAIVATVAPDRVYLKTGLRAVMPPMEPNPATAQQLLDSVPVTYIIVDEMRYPDVARKYADPVVRSYPERWHLVYCVPDTKTRIYERIHTQGN